jgi:predicted DNA-binding protein (UPF0251 family)
MSCASITVDHEPLSAEILGLTTVGQVLAHVQKDHRLVVHVLIDGQEPNLDQLPAIKQSPLVGHTLYIETCQPREMALEVLGEVELHLDEADRLRTEACDLLQQNQTAKAMEKLRRCFTTWQHAEESLLKISQLLRVDLERVKVNDRPLKQLFGEFAERLKAIRSALEDRDFVRLSDVLNYECAEMSQQWLAAIDSLRSVVE